MTLQIDFWQLVGFGFTVLSGFGALIVGAGRITASQYERRLDERFEVLDAGRVAQTKHWDERFGTLLEQLRREADGLSTLERDFLRFQADLPLHYVRREDYVRGQAVIEAKLDALYNKLEVVQMKGNRNGHS